jgi:hypothetical protein
MAGPGRREGRIEASTGLRERPLEPGTTGDDQAELAEGCELERLAVRLEEDPPHRFPDLAGPADGPDDDELELGLRESPGQRAAVV